MPRNTLDRSVGGSQARTAPAGDSGKVDNPKQGRAGLKLRSNGRADASIQAPALRPAKHTLAAYRQKLRYHPTRQQQDTIDALKRQSDPANVRRAAAQMADKDNRGWAEWGFDKLNKSDGKKTYAGRARAAAGQTGKAPSTTHLQRSMLLRQKKDVLAQFKSLKNSLNPVRKNVVTMRGKKQVGPSRPETDREVLGRVTSALSRLKFSVRDLLIIAHAQRDAIIAQRDAGKQVDADLSELDDAIGQLEKIDGQLHEIDARTESLRDQLEANATERKELRKQIAEMKTTLANYEPSGGNDETPMLLATSIAASQSKLRANQKAQKALASQLLAELGVQDKDPGLPDLPAASKTDPRQLYGAMDAVTSKLQSAWHDEPDFLANLWQQGSKAAGQMEQAQRHDAITDVLDTLRVGNIVARQSSGLSQAEKPHLLARFPGRAIQRPVDAMFAAAEQRRVATDFENAARLQLENSVTKLDTDLRKAGIPDIDPRSNDDFRANMEALKTLSRKATIRRHLDDIDRKEKDIRTEIESETKLIDEMDGKLKADQSIDGKTKSRIEQELSNRKTHLLQLKNRLRSLPEEKIAVIAAAKRDGIDPDLLRSLDQQMDEFEAQRQHVQTKITKALQTHCKGTFGFKRRRQARDLTKQLQKVESFSGPDAAKKMRKSMAVAGDGGSYRMTLAELNATVEDWQTERKALDFAAGRNLSPWQAVRRGFKLLGALIATGKPVISLAKSTSGATYKAMHIVDIKPVAKIGSEQEHAGLLELADAGLGTVLAGVSTYSALTAVKSKQEKQELGGQYIDHFHEKLLDTHDPEEKAKAKYDNRVTYYLGQALTRQRIGADWAAVNTGVISGLHYVAETGLPIALQQAALSATAVTSIVGASAGFKAIASVADAVVGAYQSNQARADRATIEKAAVDHRTDFAALAKSVGVDTGINPSKRVDTKAIRTKIDDATGLDDDTRTHLNRELDRLAESEALVDMLKGHTDAKQKVLRTVYKGLAGVGYGLKVGVTIGTVGGGLAVTGTVLIGAAAAAGMGYYGYKAYKSATRDYKARRAGDAMMGLADKPIVDKLNQSAGKRDISGDQMALNLIAAKDPTIQAKRLLGQLRSETADVIDPADVKRRIELEVKLANLDASIAGHEDKIASRGLKVDDAPDRNALRRSTNEPQVARQALLDDRKKTAAELKALNEKMAQDVLDSSRTARTLHLGQSLPPDAVLALAEADPALDDQSVGLIVESILRRK